MTSKTPGCPGCSSLDTLGAMSAPRPLTLATFVEAHSSHFASDKLIKTVGYLAGVLSVVLKKLHGQDDSRAVGLAQIAAKCGDVRYALRFCGGYCGVLFEADNVRRLTCLGGWRTPRVRHLLYAQSASLVQYYLYEHMAYLGWTAPGWVGAWLKENWYPADEMSRLSCFGWASWCVFDIWSCVVKLEELGEMEREVEKKWGKSRPTSRPGRGSRLPKSGRSHRADDARHAEALRRISKSRRGLYYNIVRSVLFLLPDIQWCAKPGTRLATFFPNWAVQGMGLAEAVIGYYTMWMGLGCSRPSLSDLEVGE